MAMTPVHEPIRDLDRGGVGSETNAIADDLIAYAKGHPVDAEVRAALDDMIVDYADAVLDRRTVLDLEACMRRSPNVARLVADKMVEFRVQGRFSAFYDGEFDPESRAEVQRLIENDPEAARLARDMRIGGDLWRVMLQPVLYEMPIPAGGAPLETLSAMLAGKSVLSLVFADLIVCADGRTVDGRASAALERLISAHIADRLDPQSVKGLEAAMRLSVNLARLVADQSAGLRR